VTPPDTQLAVGPTRLIEMTNSAGSIWSKTGTLLSVFDLNVFYAAPTGYGVSDPRVLYDLSTQRWVASAFAFDSSGNSQMYLAVSETADPVANWWVYVVTKNTSGIVTDQPKLGVTTDKVVLSWNDFLKATTFGGQETWILQKATVYAGLAYNAVSFGPDTHRFSVVPTIDETPTSTAFLTYNGDLLRGTQYGGAYVGVVSITGTPDQGNVVWSETDLAIVATHIPPNALQPGGGPLLATNDDRFTSAVWQNNRMWFAGNDACSFAGDTTVRSCAKLVQVSTTAPPAVLQDIDAGVSGGYVYFPAVGLDSSDNLFVGFSQSSSSTYAGFFASGKPAANTNLTPEVPIAAGQGIYNCGTNCRTPAGAERWGDYSGAEVDPADPTTVWVAGEYMASATDSLNWGTAVASVSLTANDAYSVVSRQQYQLANSDGTTWTDIDGGNLSLTITPSVNSSAVLGGNADLWTTQPGYSQDLGLYVAEADATQYPGHIVAWKESGGFAGTFSPNAAFVQTVFSMAGGTTYHVKLQWKTNHGTGTSGEIIAAGAGPWPLGTSNFSPTTLSVRLIPVSPIMVQTAVSTQQYQLLNSDGTTWQDLDATNLALTVTPTANSLAIISGNADLWTTMPAFNQDLGIFLQESDSTQYPGNIVAWKESGGFAGTFSPNAAFVQTVLPLTANTTYHLKLRWKTNKNTNTNGEVIVAGAGPWPAGSGSFSPTRLTVQLVPAGTNPTTAVSTQQYLSTNSDGTTWQDLDATNLGLAVTPATSCLAVISGNADLWTTQPGYNQDLGIYIQEANAAQYPGNIVAWKESGGFAGTFSPNAAFVQAVFPMSGSLTYHLKLRWKTNKNTNNSGETIVAGAGPWPASTTQFSPTRLTVQLVSCS